MIDMNSSKKNPPNSSGCFASLLEKIVCTGNLPTHPCSLEEIQLLERNHKSIRNNVVNNNDSKVVVVKPRVQTQVEANPGIVARLMGLDSLPNSKSSSTTYDSLFRSKSLNSVQFLPNFDPTRATFHHRARTSSASFHEQGYSSLVKIDENLESGGGKTKDIVVNHEELRQNEKIREKVAVLKENESRTIRKSSVSNTTRYQHERYYKGNRTRRNRTKCSNTQKNTSVVENVGDKINSRGKCAISRRKLVDKKNSSKNGSINSRKNKVDQSDISSRSPVSVLDNSLDFDSPSRQENVNARRSRSTLRSKSSPKINLLDDMPLRSENNLKSNKNSDNSSTNKITSEQKSVKAQSKDVTEYFADLSKQIYAMAEDQLCEDLIRHIRKYELVKCHFIEEFCQDFGEDVVEFLLNELTNELVESF